MLNPRNPRNTEKTQEELDQEVDELNAKLKRDFEKLKAGKSTGPTSESGKRRSAQNATTHGLFAKASLIAGESQEEFDFELNRFIDEFKPRGANEDSLLRRLADTAWRLRRLPKLEAQALEKELAEGDFEGKALKNYTIYSQRLNREYALILKTLKESQAPRLKQNGLEFRAAVILEDYMQRRGLDWDPADIGFVFSVESLEQQLAFNQTVHEAMIHSHPYATTKELDEKGAKDAA
jgi:hypothetical protein